LAQAGSSRLCIYACLTQNQRDPASFAERFSPTAIPMRLGLALIAPLLAVELGGARVLSAAELSAARAHAAWARPRHVLSSTGRLFGAGSLDLPVSFFAQPKGVGGKPTPLPAATMTTCKVLGILLLIGFCAPCLVCLPPAVIAAGRLIFGIVSLVALIYVFFWNSGIMVTYWSGGQIGGWCTVVVIFAVLQLFMCCFWVPVILGFIVGTTVAAETLAEGTAEDFAKLDANRGENQEFAPFVGTGHTLDGPDDAPPETPDDGAGVGVDRPLLGESRPAASQPDP